MSISITQPAMAAPVPINGGLRPWIPLLKAFAVLAGYSAALFAASAAVYVRQLNTQGPDAQASAGMYAFGDSVVFVAVFGFVALFPTGLGLYFLRPVRTFWTILAIAALAVAATGPVSVAMIALKSSLPNPPTFMVLCLFFGVMRMLGSPLLAAGFLLGGCLAPTRFARWALLGTTAVEGLVAAYAIFHWYIGPCFL